jgi:hypothetical protein
MNLKLGLKAASFLRVSPRAIDATWSQWMLLNGISVAIQFIWDFAHIRMSGELALNSAPGALFFVPVIFLASWALARLVHRPEQTLLLAVAFSALTIVIDTGSLLLNAALDNQLIESSIPNWEALAEYAMIAWFALAAGVAAIRLFEMPKRRLLHLRAMALACLLIGGPLSQVYTDRSLWVIPLEDDAIADEQLAVRSQVLNTEDVFYLQLKLLDKALAAIKPGKANEINLYFVGAAGFAEQDVFMKEVKYVNTLFQQRFGTAQRSVMLINNPKTATVLPIASSTSLRAAFGRVAQVMNRDKDILFLYLTSHGSMDHKFSLEFGSMQFNALDPRILRDMLDQSGIRQRVIVISACYSGGFIHALKNDDTLVISAAAADKTSFGCSNEADFTYFGRAYFQQAMHQTDSFIEAFALAKPAIAKREIEVGYERSDPRIFVGRHIRAALSEFERQRQNAIVPEAKPATPHAKRTRHQTISSKK